MLSLKDIKFVSNDQQDYIRRVEREFEKQQKEILRRMTLTEKERKILIDTLEKQLVFLKGNDLETAKVLLIYLRRI